MSSDVETAAAAASSGQPPGGRLAAGTTLAGGRFTVGQLVRQGALAEVYDGVDSESGDPVSIHLLRAELAGVPAIAERVLAGGAALVGVTQKNLATTLAAETTPAGVAIVTELVEGHSLRELLARKQKTGGSGFGARGTGNIAGGVLAALSAMHPAHAHGGLSADTVFVNKAGRVKVIDAALAAAVPAAVKAGLAGAPPSLAPEDAASGAPSAAGDLYAAGHLAYQLLVGRALVKGGPRPSDVESLAPAVDELVARCCAPAPGQRPASAAELRDALLAALKQPAPDRAQAPTALSSPSMRLPAMAEAEAPAPAPPRPSAQVAAPSVGDTDEKWLISKGKLDYGPFTLAAVVEEIRADKVEPGNIIVNKDTGERCYIEDHPLLAAEVERAKQLRDDRRRAHAEHQTVQKETRRGKALFVFIGVGALALAIGVYFLVKGRTKAPFAPTIASMAKGGDTQWEYAIVVIKGEGAGRVASVKKKISDGAATLSDKSGNQIKWPKVDGAEAYIVYRTTAGGSPGTTGVIGRVGPDTQELVNTGLDGDGSNLAEAVGALEDGKLLAKISFPEPPKRKSHSRSHRRRHRSGGNGGGDDSPGGFDFGSEGGQEVLDQGQINPVIQRSGRRLAHCLLSKGARAADIEFVIKGTGRVSRVTVSGANSAATACINGVVKSMKFPSFDGNTTIARFDMSL